jgi:hypothetical protein
VTVGQPITLRVRILGKGPSEYAPRRDKLHLFPDDWDRDFFVEPVPAEDRIEPQQGTYDFVYRLRPKHNGVHEISGLRLSYYLPGRGYQKALQADPIPITVRPAPPPTVPEHLPVLAAPPSFYEFRTGPDALNRSPDRSTWPGWVIAIILLAPPLVALLLVRRGSALRNRATVQRSDAARRALARLRADGEPAWAVVGDYLTERVGLPAAGATPAEAQRCLRTAGVARPLCREVADFFQACDADRFSGAASANPHTLRQQALGLIEKLEAELCVR